MVKAVPNAFARGYRQGIDKRLLEVESFHSKNVSLFWVLNGKYPTSTNKHLGLGWFSLTEALQQQQKLSNTTTRIQKLELQEPQESRQKFKREETEQSNSKKKLQVRTLHVKTHLIISSAKFEEST